MVGKQPWVDGLTFGQALSSTAKHFPDNDALVFPQAAFRCSFADFQDRVGEVARALMALGLKQGEHIGIWATNWPQWVLVQFAAARLGAVLVNINPAYRAHELAYVLGQADIAILVTTDRFKNSDFVEILNEVCPGSIRTAHGEVHSPAFPKLHHVVGIKDENLAGVLPWSDFLKRAAHVQPRELEEREQGLKSDDIVNIQYTSGTTGFPKGAMLTHRNLLMNAYYVGRRLAFTDRDRLCIPVPYYHCFGCVMGTLMCALHGAAMVVPSEGFDPEATLEAIDRERCTGVYGVPTMFIAELHQPRFAEFDLKSLRTGIMAGSPCPIEVMRAVVDRLGVRELTIAYGLTEASPVITHTETTDDLEHRVSTVGRPLPGLEVKIVAPGKRDAVALGQPGELMVRGHGVMKGYYHKPAETEEVLSTDGWLRTGDLAVQMTDGYYRITGRIKDVIIRGGENVYPREIEEFLFTHPNIADAQVVGLPDDRFVEEISAWVRLKPDCHLSEKELREFCRGKIARYKVPRYFVFVDQYPTTVTGKVQKFKLRELGIERFGLQKAAGMETA